jgi:GNAT superfamily N-acetyltransferase
MNIGLAPGREAPLATTGDGRPVVVRRLGPGDRLLVARLLGRLSDTSWWLRYQTPRSRSAEVLAAETERIASADPSRHTTLLAVAHRGGAEEAVAMAELVRAAHGSSAELAIVVLDAEQRRGIGGELVQRLIGIAREQGLASLHIDSLAENRGMLALIRGIRAPHTIVRGWGEVRATVELNRGGAPAQSEGVGLEKFHGRLNLSGGGR